MPSSLSFWSFGAQPEPETDILSICLIPSSSSRLLFSNYLGRYFTVTRLHQEAYTFNIYPFSVLIRITYR